MSTITYDLTDAGLTWTLKGLYWLEQTDTYGSEVAVSGDVEGSTPVQDEDYTLVYTETTDDNDVDIVVIQPTAITDTVEVTYWAWRLVLPTLNYTTIATSSGHIDTYDEAYNDMITYGANLTDFAMGANSEDEDDYDSDSHPLAGAFTVTYNGVTYDNGLWQISTATATDPVTPWVNGLSVNEAIAAGLYALATDVPVVYTPWTHNGDLSRIELEDAIDDISAIDEEEVYDILEAGGEDYLTVGTRAEDTAGGTSSVSIGESISATYPNQVVVGTYNVAGDYPIIVGNGTESTPANTYTVSRDGDIWSAGDITVGNHNSPIGTIVEGMVPTGGGTVNLTSGVSKIVRSNNSSPTLQIQPGTWVIVLGVYFESDEDGSRRVSFTTDNTDDKSDGMHGRMVSESRTATPDTTTYFNLVRTTKVTSATNFYLWAYQNSGRTLKCSVYYQLTRIA